MKTRFVKIFSIIMMAVFLYGITPVEFLHDLFSTHQDTVDVYHPKGSPDTISNQHTHCDFLSIAYCEFLSSANFYVNVATEAYPAIRCVAVVNYYYSLHEHIINTRGPPTFLSTQRPSYC